MSSVSAGWTVLGNIIFQTGSHCQLLCHGAFLNTVNYSPLCCSVTPCSRMAKGKKIKQAKSKTITLKEAQNCVELTLDGVRRLNLSFKEVATVPKCIQKLCEMDELDLSRNLIAKVPDFIGNFIRIRVLDLHSNYVGMTQYFGTHASKSIFG